MFDRIFSAALAFVVLGAGTAAIGAAWFEPSTPRAQLPRVEVVGKRTVPVQLVAQCEPGAVTQVR